MRYCSDISISLTCVVSTISTTLVHHTIIGSSDHIKYCCEEYAHLTQAPLLQWSIVHVNAWPPPSPMWIKIFFRKMFTSLICELEYNTFSFELDSCIVILENVVLII